MCQHHPAHAAPADADVGGLHGNADGEREVVEVPVIRVALTVGKTQCRFFAVAGVEQAGVVQAADAAAQQPGTCHRQPGVQVMQGQRATLQAAAGDQLQGHGGQAGNGSDAHGEQHQASIFVLDPGDFAHGLGRGAAGQPEHQQQVQPDANVPAGERALNGVSGRDEPSAGKADQGGNAQARVGTGEAVKNHRYSQAGAWTPL